MFGRFTTVLHLLPMRRAYTTQSCGCAAACALSLSLCLTYTAHKPNGDELVGDNAVQIIPSIATYFHDINGSHCEKIQLIDILFKTVEPILIKLECIVLGSNSGQFENMCLYYAFWENQLLELLIRYFVEFMLFVHARCTFHGNAMLKD